MRSLCAFLLVESLKESVNEKNNKIDCVSGIYAFTQPPVSADLIAITIYTESMIDV